MRGGNWSLINQRDVIRMKIPYPGIESGLAVASHMYICKGVNGNLYQYVKCQTLKPGMMSRNMLKHFVDEVPDQGRNPFLVPTRIDCDKLFLIDSVSYDDRLKTQIRSNVCQDLYQTVIKELGKDGYNSILLNGSQLAAINPLITQI